MSEVKKLLILFQTFEAHYIFGKLVKFLEIRWGNFNFRLGRTACKHLAALPLTDTLNVIVKDVKVSIFLGGAVCICFQYKIQDFPGGLKMPALGYGTWQASGDCVERGVETALEAGYRHIDTAAAYNNEDVIGLVLKRWFDSEKLTREDVFITTKLAATCLLPDKVEQFLNESLQKLQLEYVDLYLVHFPVCIIVEDDGSAYGDPNTDHLALWEAMEAQVDAGRTKSIGVSNFNERQIDRILKNCRIKPANNQVELHVYMQQKELLDFCKENEVTVVAYSPLGSPGYNEFLKNRNMPCRKIPNLLSNLVVQRIAQKHSKTSAQVLLRYLLQLGVGAIPKSVTPARIKENIQIFNFELDKKDMKELLDLEIGTSIRVLDWLVFKELAEHPEYPF